MFPRLLLREASGSGGVRTSFFSEPNGTTASATENSKEILKRLECLGSSDGIGNPKRGKHLTGLRKG
jgi:hypothetical protein